MTWVTNWPLLGALRWSDLGTFELDGEALLLNRAMVLGAAAFLGAVSVRAFRRSEPDPAATRARRSPSAIAREARALAPFLLLAVLPATVLSARIRSGFQGAPEAARARDYWRRNVATWSGVETATLRHVDVKVALEPAERRMRVDGVFVLVNGTPAALRRLAFTVGPAFEGVAWTVDGAEAAFEDRSGLHVLAPRGAAAGRRGEGRLRVRGGLPAGRHAERRRNLGVHPAVRRRPPHARAEFPSRAWLRRGNRVDRENRSEPPELPDDFCRASWNR